jgi:F-type H+-transporting ATPase subunit b
MGDDMSTEPIVQEAAGLCVNEHGGAIGMPQLCADWMPNQIFWLLVTLVVIYFVLSKIALPRIARCWPTGKARSPMTSPPPKS